VVANSNHGGSVLELRDDILGGNATVRRRHRRDGEVGGAVSQTAAAGNHQTGVGTLNLAATNTYAGVTNVNAGTLIAGANGALGTSTGAADGTIVAFGRPTCRGGHLLPNENLFLNGNRHHRTNGALSSSTAASFAAPSRPSELLDRSSAATLTLTGGIVGGTFNLVFAGAGKHRDEHRSHHRQRRREQQGGGRRYV